MPDPALWVNDDILVHAVHRMLRDHGVRHFSSEELVQRHKGLPALHQVGNMVPTLFIADKLRDEFGLTRVRSAFRGPTYNRSIGGADDSMHLYFNALDLVPHNGTPADWASFVKTSFPAWGGLGTYSDFIHIDTRSIVFRRPAVTWSGA